MKKYKVTEKYTRLIVFENVEASSREEAIDLAQDWDISLASYRSDPGEIDNITVEEMPYGN